MTLDSETLSKDASSKQTTEDINNVKFILFCWVFETCVDLFLKWWLTSSPIYKNHIFKILIGNSKHQNAGLEVGGPLDLLTSYINIRLWRRLSLFRFCVHQICPTNGSIYQWSVIWNMINQIMYRKYDISNNRGEDTCLFTSASLQQLCPYIRKDQYVSQGGRGWPSFHPLIYKQAFFSVHSPFQFFFGKFKQDANQNPMFLI